MNAKAGGGYKYTDLTPQEAGNIGAWISQTVFATGNNYQGYVTVGGDGFTGYIPGNFLTLGAYLGGYGYLTGAAWDGSEYLLVGEQYTPGGGVIMILYNPVLDCYLDLSYLFPGYMSDYGTQTSLLSVTWTGSQFVILGDFQIDDSAFLMLYSFNPSTMTLTDITYQIPSSYQECFPCSFAGFGNHQLMAGSPRGIYLLVDTGAIHGYKFGLLRTDGTFSDLTSFLPTGFWEMSPGGIPQNMIWAKGSLWIAGCVYANCGALLSYNPVTGKMIDYSSLFTLYSPFISYLTSARGLLYVGGSTSGPLFFASWDFVSPRINVMINLLPANGQVDSIAVGGTSIFVTTGYFGYLEYGILALSH